MPVTEKKIEVEGQEEKITFRKEGGAGYKECKSCSGPHKSFKFVASQTAKKIKKCHCGTAYEIASRQSKNPFNGLKESHYALILRLAEEVRTGKKISRPEVTRPTVEDYRSAGTDLEKIGELNVAQDEWKVYDSAGIMTKGQRKRLEDAAKSVYGDK